MQPTTTPADTTRQPCRLRRLVPLLVPVVLLAACSSGGSDAEAATTAAPTTVTTTTVTTTTTTEVSVEEAGEAFQELIAGADSSIDYEADVRDGFAEESDVAGAAESAIDLRVALDLVDEDLRELEAPADVLEVMNDVLIANGSYIKVLDGYVEVVEVDEYNDQLQAEAEVRESWYETVNAAAEVFGTDGIESDFESVSGDEPGGAEPEGGSASSAGLISGDGSDYCLQDGDLPDAFLPPAGQDNLSNALSYTFDQGREADYADALVASWMVLPEGGAGPEDLTADCLIHIFDSPEAAEGFYDAWTADYGSGSFPVPQLAVVAEDAPGEDPQAYTKLFGDRPQATQVFRYANVVVSVGISGTAQNDIETVLVATNDLAKKVDARLQTAG